MSFFTHLSRLGRSMFVSRRLDPAHSLVVGQRMCRFEDLESRDYMAADIHVGAVYREPASGTDASGGNFLEVSFVGGAAGTELTQISIECDKHPNSTSLQASDDIFDTAPGGLGVFGSSPLEIVSHDGFDVVSTSVVDGGTRLTFNLQGFTAGEKLVFKIDVDEVQFVDPVTGALDINAIVEGSEFQRSRLETAFTAPHYNQIQSTATFWDAYDTNFANADQATNTHLDLPPDRWDPNVDLSDFTAGAVDHVTQIPLPNTLSGVVYVDSNLNNQLDAGEQGIGRVTLDLMKFDGSQYVDTGMTTMTDAKGAYKFDAVPLGTYRVVETQPVGYFSVGASAGNVAGQTRGIVVSPDILSQIDLLGGEDSVQNDFAEALPNSISGHVLVDMNGDCIQQPGEPSLAGVVIHLLDSSDNIIATTTTDVDGNYKFDNLAPGTYGVEKVMPTGYFNDDDHVGTAGGVIVDNDRINQIHLTSGVDGLHYDYCVIPPTGVSGYVYVDLNNDGIRDPGGIAAGEPGIAGVTLILKDANGQPTGATAITDENGFYHFDGLFPTTYAIAEVQPAGYYDGLDSPGSAGGTAHNPGDLISGILLQPAVLAVNYNFGELLPSSISGHVLVDLNGDCIQQPGEPNLAGVTIHLLDGSDHVIGTTTTDVDGNYKFDHLAPGTYGVEKILPPGYFNDDSHVGTAGGVIESDDRVDQIPLGPGVDGLHYDFCVQLPASISGHVLVDLNGDCIQQPGEPSLAGVTIHLLDAANNIIQTTMTDVDGNYKFDNLAPGTYGVEKVMPAGYFNDDDHVGTAGGQIVDDDRMINIHLGSGVDGLHYDYCVIPPAQVSGYVYSDLNNNGIRETGEAGIAGVTLNLNDTQGHPTGMTAITDANGFYSFQGLRPDTYSISEVQPAGYLDGLDSAGTAGGTAINPGDQIVGITLNPAVDAEDYNFGELLPASIGGHVHVDINGDCIQQPDEPSLAGVVIHLLDSSNNIIQTTTTNTDGNYKFSNLAPGTYGVEKELPAGYFEDDSHVGTAGGVIISDDRVIGAQLGSGVNATGYDYCVVPPSTISGIVFQDGPPIETTPGDQNPHVAAVRDGVYRPGDRLLTGVRLELRNGVTGEAIMTSAAIAGAYNFDGPIYTTTDQNGYYQFIGLPAGNYAVYEIQPQGFIDGIDTPGSLGGIAVNPDGNIDPQILQQLSVSPHDDAIIRISLPAGQATVQNNFSEVTTANFFFFTVPPPQAPPFVPGAPGTPPTPGQPGLPPPTVPYTFTPFTPGAHVMSYTWHLSVVNAGQPRVTNSDEAEVQLTAATHTDIIAFQQTNLQESEWNLASRADGARRQFRRLLFGMKGGIPVTGDFNGDGVTDIGVFKDGQWFIDLNGNGIWDEGDLWAKLGSRGDKPVTGDWDGDGKTDIGIYGPAWPGDPRAVAAEPGLPDPHNKTVDIHKNVPRPAHKTALGERALKRTAHGDVRADLIDHVFHYGTPGDMPISGDWNGDGIDTIGVFHDGKWYRDMDGDGKWTEADGVAFFGQPGDVPIIGDWNGDGIDDIGVYRDGVWILDTNGNGRIDAEDQVIKLGGPGDTPVVGDWDGNGRQEPGVYHGDATRNARK